MNLRQASTLPCVRPKAGQASRPSCPWRWPGAPRFLSAQRVAHTTCLSRRATCPTERQVNSDPSLRLNSGDNENVHFAGRIDDGRIYNRALTATEIRRLALSLPGANGFWGLKTHDPASQPPTTLFWFDEHGAICRGGVWAKVIFTDDLAAPNWQVVPGTAGWVPYAPGTLATPMTWTNVPANVPHRFFRARVK